MRGRKAKLPKAAAGMPKLPKAGTALPRTRTPRAAAPMPMTGGLPTGRRRRGVAAANPLADIGMLQRTPFRGIR